MTGAEAVRSDDRRAVRALRTAAILLLLVLACYSLTLANPGFFNHDEWQKYDHVARYGFADFARAYGSLKAGPDFGFPVRPLGFLQQGFTGMWMGTRPFVPHLFDVLQHGLIAVLFAAVLARAGLPRRTVGASAVVFAVSPLATVSTGWVGASFDRWYVGFSLVAAYGVVSQLRGLGARSSNFALVAAGMALALLSKETAAVLPAALVLVAFAVWFRQGADGRVALRAVLPQAALLVGVAGIPLLAYLGLRWPAIVASAHGEGGAYSPSLANIPANALLYFAQPFYFGAVELESAQSLPWGRLLFAVLAHAALVAAFWRRYGTVDALLYLAAYAVFLLPVLPLHFAGAHYLYGSGVPFAAMVGLLLAPARDEAGGPAPRLAPLAMSVVLAMLGFRSLEIQLRMYDHGVCENRFLNTYLPEARAEIRHGAAAVQLVVDPGAMGYVAERSLFGREQFSAGGEIPSVVGGVPGPGMARLHMGSDCRVRPE